MSYLEVLRTKVMDVLRTPIWDVPCIEDHMGTFIGRLLETSTGRDFAEWVSGNTKLKK